MIHSICFAVSSGSLVDGKWRLWWCAWDCWSPACPAPMAEDKQGHPQGRVDRERTRKIMLDNWRWEEKHCSQCLHYLQVHWLMENGGCVDAHGTVEALPVQLLWQRTNRAIHKAGLIASGPVKSCLIIEGGREASATQSSGAPPLVASKRVQWVNDIGVSSFGLCYQKEEEQN